MTATDDKDKDNVDDIKGEIKLLKAIKLEREITDKLYAIKLVETIVFSMVGIILVAVFAAILKFVIIK
jgi:hypothetical protein